MKFNESFQFKSCILMEKSNGIANIHRKLSFRLETVAISILLIENIVHGWVFSANEE